MSGMFNDKLYQVEEKQKNEFLCDEELQSENWNALPGGKIIEKDKEDDNSSDNGENWFRIDYTRSCNVQDPIPGKLVIRHSR